MNFVTFCKIFESSRPGFSLLYFGVYPVYVKYIVHKISIIHRKLVVDPEELFSCRNDTEQ